MKTIVALAVMSLAFAAAAHSQEQQSLQQSFKAIIGKGYDIKAVTFATVESREGFVVTLQKEKSVAVCYFAAGNWINLSNQFLDNPKSCDVRY